MKLKVESSDKFMMSFRLQNSSPGYSNAIRRIILTEVPVMAIEEVEIKTNNSALYDEMVAHRLGLVPLTTDLKTYEMPESEEDIKERRAKCVVQLTLKEKGPKIVTASSMKSNDPKVKPVYGDMPLVKLLKDQEIELVAYAVLGKGEDHIKWSPGHVWYNYSPTLKINNEHPDIEKYKEMYPPEIFDSKGKIDQKLIIENNLVDAVAHINPEIIQVDYDDQEYLFNMESWGQISNKEILISALDAFDGKLDKLNDLI